MLHKVKDDRFFMPRLYLLSCIYLYIKFKVLFDNLYYWKLGSKLLLAIQYFDRNSTYLCWKIQSNQ